MKALAAGGSTAVYSVRVMVELQVAALLCVGASLARADDENSPALAEIVVTAQKRSENAQDVPITINALTAKDLTIAGVTSAASLTTLVPGLTVTTNSGTFQPRLRGVGTAFFGPGIENPVALYVDDVYYGSQLMAPTDFSDASQINVLYGPQGTLFGRNTTGGVIQVAALDPQSQPNAQISTELDNYWTSRTFGYVTGPVANDLNANLSLKYNTQGDGWGRNLATGNYTHRLNSDLALRTKWAWKPSDQTLVKLSLDYENYVNSMGANQVQYPAAGWTGIFPGKNVTQFSTNPYDSTNYIDNRNQLTYWGASVRVEQELGFARLVSITAYRTYHGDTVEDTNGSPIPFNAILPYDFAGSQLTQELQLVSPKGERFDWVAGAFYYGALDKLNPLTLPFSGPFAQIFYPPTQDLAVSVNNIDLSTHSPAVFAQGDVTLGAHTHFTGGVRWTHEQRRITGTNDVYLDGSTTPSPIYSAVFGPATGGDFADSHWTFRAALNHDFSSNLMGYVSYNTGFKSGGFNAITGTPQPPYKAETVKAFEAGLKSEMLDRTLRLNVAGFYSKYDNLQLLLIQGCCINAVNAADATIFGADLNTEWRPINDFSVSGGVEWLHARFGNFPGLPYSVPADGGGINTYPGFPPLPERNGDGLTLPFSPNVTGNLALTYTAHAGPDKVLLSVTDRYSGRFFFEPDNYNSQGSFNEVNTTATWFSADERLSVALIGRNLTDKIVPTTVAAYAPTGWLADYGNPPRTYGVAVHYWLGAAP